MRVIAAALWVTAWAAGATGGTVYLWKYASTPGVIGQAPTDWPKATALKRSENRFTLVIALHPHCPCSSASAEELGQLLTDERDKLSVYALLVRPPGVGEDWTETSLAHTVAGFPSVTSVIDKDGREAELFGAKTSGEVLLYSPDGRLQFHGGITDSRGHTGDNAGCDAIRQIVARQTHDFRITPVFGCPLLGPSDLPSTSSTASSSGNGRISCNRN